MRFFILYDDNGDAVRRATALSPTDARALIEAGFVEVTEEVYNAFVATVPEFEPRNIAEAIGIGGLLGQLLTRRKPPTVLPKPPPELVKKLQTDFSNTVKRHTSNYLSGEMTLNQWYGIMSREVRKLHLAAGAIGAGGWQDLGGMAMELVLSQVREHVDFLERFRDQIQAALDENLPLSDRFILARAAAYGGAANETVELAYTATLGLPRLPAYPGRLTACYSNCKCSWDIRQLPLNGNWDCFWNRSPVESCPTCLARERAFSPLRIRNGIIQPYPRGGIYR